MNLTILHLSDIHIHDSTDLILSKAIDIASACYTSARESDACLIIVTGDIAFSGERHQYCEAKSFLLSIKNAIQNEGCLLVDIITVPGNHDCHLIPEDRARSLIIEKIISDPEEASHEDIIDLCTKSQNDYFEFQSLITDLVPVLKHKLWNEYEFNFNGNNLRISAINASWMSRITEKPGQLVFPIELFKNNLEVPAKIRLALIHHPLNWYCQNSYHPLRQSLREHSNLILSGHEHNQSSGLIKDSHDGSSLYFEGAALQPHEKSLKSSFSVSYLSFDENNIEENVYISNENGFVKLEVNNHVLFDETNQYNGKYELTSDFHKHLCDPGGNFTHPEKDDISIDDIFVYPDVKNKSAVTANDNNFISIENILFHGHKKQKILLLGEEKSGKSIILLRTFSHYHKEGLLPVYIRANDLALASDKEIKKLLDRQIKLQYISPSTLDQAEKEKKIAIVDDIDKIPNIAKILHSLIQYLERHFSSIILSANSEFELASLVNNDVSNSLAAYDSYEIQRFNLSLRHKLIKRWCLCGTVNTKPELDQQIHKIEGLVNAVIGKSLVPSQPIYLLILIQSCLQEQQNELQNSGFAYYYQYIITKSFGEVGVKREDLNALFNYLSRFAWYLRKNDADELALPEIKIFNQEYSRDVDTVNLDERLELLCRAKILIKRGNYYSFTYPYIYFYFLGKFLADNLHKSEIKEIVEKYCDSLYKYQNSHAILFLTHHNNNHPWIVERILSVLQGCFKDIKAMEFNHDVEKINTLIDKTTHRLLIAEPDVDKNQEEFRKYDDECKDNQIEKSDLSNEIAENISFSSKMNLLLRTAEILGQIVKNYYGSLERSVKQPIIHEIFNSPLRLLGSVFEIITNDPLSFVKEIEKAIEKEHPHLTPDEKEETARKLTFNLLGFIGTGIVLRTAQFVSSNKLHEDIYTVVKNNQTNAYKLIEAATHLSQPGHLPFEEIRKLASDLKDNPFGFKILQSLGVYHLYHYHMREPDKQKLCSFLDMEITKSHRIDIQTKHRKLLK